MEFINLVQNSPLLFTITSFVIGLLVGSFLNVVIHRLPIMLRQQWREECVEFLELENDTKSAEKISLWRPRSRCPHCRAAISAFDNIPLLSYFLLRGQCRHCQQAISPRYPLIEMGTAFVTLNVAIHFGPNPEALAAILLTWTLIASMMIDYDHQIIPDIITLPMLWLGLLLNINGLFVPLSDAVMGAVAGYCSLWLFIKGFYLITGKVGMGHGDFKLFAMFGAWLGWQSLPFILIASSFVGAIIGIGLMMFSKADRDTAIPFGPYLAIAGWLAMLWGPQINEYYLRVMVS